MLNHYKLSRKFSPIVFICLLLVCAIVVPIPGIIYAYSTWYTPIIYANFLITFGFGVSIPSVMSLLVVRLEKVRNYGLSVPFATIASLVVYYSQWMVWVDLILNAGEVYGSEQMDISVSNIQFRQLLHSVTHSGDLIDSIMLINEEGTWDIRSMTVSGTFLSIIWLIEFGTIMFFGLMAVGRSKVPFSEVTEEWFKEEELPAFTYIDSPNSFKQVVEQGNWEALTETSQLAGRQASHGLFTTYVPGNDYHFSVHNVKTKANGKGKIEFNTDEFMKYLHISKTIYDMLKARA